MQYHLHRMSTTSLSGSNENCVRDLVKTETSSVIQITLNDLLTKGATRKTAAQKFYTLLVLKKSQAINVEQHAPYEDIYISTGPNVAQALAK
ncbi:hypothetical protein COOONC_14396 [Cooperia oncophora]